MPTWLFSTKLFVAFLRFHATHFAGLFVTPDTDSDTFTILSSRLHCYKYSFFPRTISEWNKLSQDVRSKPSIASFRSALLKLLDQSKIISEPWHFGSNGRTSIAGYLLKNRRTKKNCVIFSQVETLDSVQWCLNVAKQNNRPTCTKFGQSVLRKIFKFGATRWHLLTLKCTKFDFGWGSAPDPAGGAYSAPPVPLAGF